MQDPDPMPWGAQDRFQAHFIVRKEVDDSQLLDFTARTKLQTKGYFGSKTIIGIKWVGGKLAEKLNENTSLSEQIISQSVNDAMITIEPTNNGVRIFGKWKNEYEFGITNDLFSIYDEIAGHIKKIRGKQKPKIVSKSRGTLPKGYN